MKSKYLKIISLRNTFHPNSNLGRFYRDSKGEELILNEHPAFEGFNGYSFDFLDDQIDTDLLSLLEIPTKFGDTVEYSSGNSRLFHTEAALGDFDGCEKLLDCAVEKAKNGVRNFIAKQSEHLADPEEYPAELEHYRLESLKKMENLFTKDCLFEYINEITSCNNSEFNELDELLSYNRELYQLLFLDSIFDCLINKKGVGIIKEFHRAICYGNLFSNTLKIVDPVYENPEAEYYKSRTASKRQEASLERFNKAINMALSYAKSSWAEDPSLRYGEIANDIRKAIKLDLKSVGLSTAPTIKAIKGWIVHLAPSEACFKAGRPKK